VKPEDLGGLFHLTFGDDQRSPIELNCFLGEENVRLDAPQFSPKLQEVFWGICDLLNTEIRKREPGAAQTTTEEFVLDMLREGTVKSPDEATKALRDLHRASQQASYVSLGCRDPQAMRDALRDRMRRAQLSSADLGKRFHLTPKNTRDYIELSNFMNASQPNLKADGPLFGAKLQEQFWDICALLNDEIQKREGGTAQTTEAFVLDLLSEGTVKSHDEVADKLRKLHEFVDGPSQPKRSKG
jgi:hypothetical protein